MNKEIRTGRIIKGIGGAYVVHSHKEDCIASVRGILRKKKITPTIGDQVSISISGDPDIPYVIESVLPRRNILVRPSVANIDILILVFSPVSPEPDLKLLDKLLIVCGQKNIKPVIWVTKIDLEKEKALEIGEVYEKAGFSVVYSSYLEAMDKTKTETLFDHNTVGLAGQSGVGKSTLCNALVCDEVMNVGFISQRLHRGKHTTRHVELFPVGSGYLIDTPGFSSLELDKLGVELEEIKLGYPEILAWKGQCKFLNCLHNGEFGCTISNSKIDPERLARYHYFIAEMQQTKKQMHRKNKYKSNKQ